MQKKLDIYYICLIIGIAAIDITPCKIAKPILIAGLRPMVSDTGPKNICPAARPRKTADITSWLSFANSTPRSPPMIGKAGNIASVESATIDVISAISATNSMTERFGTVLSD